MTFDLARGHLDRGGPGVAGEVVPAGEPAYVPDLPEHHSSGRDPDALDVGDARVPVAWTAVVSRPLMSLILRSSVTRSSIRSTASCLRALPARPWARWSRAAPWPWPRSASAQLPPAVGHEAQRDPLIIEHLLAQVPGPQRHDRDRPDITRVGLADVTGVEDPGPGKAASNPHGVNFSLNICLKQVDKLKNWLYFVQMVKTIVKPPGRPNHTDGCSSGCC